MSCDEIYYDKNVDNKVSTILNKVLCGEKLTKEDAIALLDVDIYSKDMYNILASANILSRKHFKNHGEIYAQKE